MLNLRGKVNVFFGSRRISRLERANSLDATLAHRHEGIAKHQFLERCSASSNGNGLVRNNLLQVCWNVTGTILASSGDDGCVKLWKVRNDPHFYQPEQFFCLKSMQITATTV